MIKNTFKIFVDFDGTISAEDVGDAIFREFGNLKTVNKIIDDLLADRISSKSCWEKLCQTTGTVDKSKLDNLIDRINIDDTFSDFVKYCKEHSNGLIVLSDGFDYYIEKIFEKYSLQGIKYYANKLNVTADGVLVPEFPYYDSNCVSSANCKRNHVINHSSDEDITVYIGDGNSDKDAAQYCDFIFAKSNLLKYCEVNRITYFPYNNFLDVIKRLDDLKSKKRIKKRHQALIKRKQAYIQE